MRLPKPTLEYSRRNADRLNEVLEQEFSRRRTVDEQLILRSPNGTPYIIGVDNAGVITSTPA